MTTVRVSAKNRQATHDISLADDTQTWGIKLMGGARGVSEAPATPSNIRITGGGTKFGDFDPMHSHIEQRTWEGGRGAEDFFQNETRFFDSMNAWTLTPEKAHPAPQWTFGENYRPADNLLPGAALNNMGNDVHWMSIGSTNLHAISFTAVASTYIMDRVQMWVRRIGTPPSKLTVGVHAADGADDPGAQLGSATLLSTAIAEGVSVLHEFVLSSASGKDLGQADATDYFVQVNATTAGNARHHWDIGYATSSGFSSTSVYSADAGTNWSTRSDVWPYFRVSGLPTSRKWRFFNLDGALYAVDQPTTSTTSQLYINGDRGKAKGSSAGSTSTITDTSKNWSTAVWSNDGAWVKTIRGTGAGQKSAITANASNALSVDLAVAISSDTEYVIYGTDKWTQVATAVTSSAWTAGAVQDVAVANQTAFFALGPSTNIGQLTWNSSVHAAYKDCTTADSVHTFYDPVDGAQLWRSLSTDTTIARSAIPAFGSSLVFSSGIPIGDKSFAITEIADYNDQLYVFKEDSLWTVKNDRAARLNLGLEAMPSSNNGACWAAQDFFLFFPWAHSLERLYGGTLDDIGPWKGAGLPSGRQGVVSSLEPVIGWMFAGIDAGSTGTSSVLVWNDQGWHEIFRAWAAGKRVQGIKWQPCPGTKDRLWISVGGDIVSLQFPKNSLNPLNDDTMNYQHESHIVTGSIDMGVAQLPKLFHEIFIISKSLQDKDGVKLSVAVEYQVDEGVGTDTWISLGEVFYSPSYSLNINQGNKHKIRFRFRMMTNDASVPPVMDATVLKGIARTPTKRQWTLRAEVSDFQVTSQGLPDHAPDDFYLWWQDAAIQTKPLHMRSVWEAMDDLWVYAEPPVVNRQFATPDGDWGAVFSVTLREI